MIDLHTHTIFSDGALIPAELIQRAVSKGYKAIAITDHIDQSNIDFIIPRLARAIDSLKPHIAITAIAGAEITHVPPELIPEIVKEARRLGAKMVVVHGETIVEPVKAGTNRAAIEAGADILSHPGLITRDDLLFAKERGITLEITARKGHSLSNGYVLKSAMELGIPVVINTDAHEPSDLITKEFAVQVLLSAGMAENQINAVFEQARTLVNRALKY
jgi:histidinol phosphatase-like PHP family hydrolase